MTKRMRLRSGYSGTCIVCLSPTDTAVGFRGDVHWLAGGLFHLGVPAKEVMLTLRAGDDAVAASDDGQFEMPVRVCSACVATSPFVFKVKPMLAIPGALVPTATQPERKEDRP